MGLVTRHAGWKFLDFDRVFGCESGRRHCRFLHWYSGERCLSGGGICGWDGSRSECYFEENADAGARAAYHILVNLLNLEGVQLDTPLEEMGLGDKCLFAYDEFPIS